MASTRSLGTLTLDLIAKIGGFQQGMDRAARAADTRSRQINRSIQGIQRSFTNMGRNIRRAAAGLLAGFSFVAVIRSTVEAEKQIAQLESRIQSTGGAAGFTTSELVDMAKGFQDVTTFGDETINSMQKVLLTFTQIRGDRFREATEAILNMSEVLGKDLLSSVTQVGKALNDPVLGVSALAEAGIQFTEQQKDLIKQLVNTGDVVGAQGIILEELETQFGGAAVAARDTFGGALKGLKNAAGDLLEGGGGNLTDAKNAINDLTAILQDPATIQAFGDITSAIIILTGAVTKAVAGFANLGKEIGEGFARLAGAGTPIDQAAERIEDIQRTIDSLSEFGVAPGSGLEFIIKQHQAEQAELQKLVDLNEELEKGREAANAAASSAAGGGTVRATPPTEEFLKIAARLKEQIALHGKTGEAAKLSFQIQSGALDELSEAERGQVLALARQFDALVQSAEASKQLGEAQQKAEAEVGKMVETLTQQIATIGKTEAEIIAYRVAQGDLAETIAAGGAAAQAYADDLLRLTAEYEALTAATEAQKKAESEIAEIIDATRTPLEEYEAAIMRLNELRDMEGSALDPETYRRAAEAAQDAFESATKEVNTFAEQASRNAQDIISSNLRDGFDDGAKGILQSFGDLITDLASQAIAADIAGKLFGTEGVGSGGGLIGKAASFLDSIFGGARADGGPVAGGHLYRVNERGVEGLSIPGRGDYLLTGSQGGEVIPNSRLERGGRSSVFNNSFHIQGKLDNRTVSQLNAEQARRQRIVTARLG